MLIQHTYMKLLVTALICWISTSAFAQNKYNPDDHVEISGEPGDFKISNYYTGKVLANHVKIDDIVTSVHHGLIGFEKDGKIGFVSIYGKIVKPAQFDDFSMGEGSYRVELHGDYFAVRKGELTGLIDSTGAFAVPLGTYDYLWDSGKGTCGAEINGLFGLFRKGKAILPVKYVVEYEYQSFTHETMPVSNDSAAGLINSNGKFVLPMEYTISEFEETYWLLEKDGFSVLADFNGKIVSQTMDYILHVENGLIFGQRMDKYGVEKFDGTIVCPFEYDYMTTKPVDGAVFARKESLWGYLSLAHPEKTAFIYDNPYTPGWRESGLAPMQKGGYWGMINTKNEVVVDFLYTIPRDYMEFNYGAAFVIRNDLWGMLSESGELIIPCEYEEIEQYGGFPKKVKKNGRVGLINSKGKIRIPADYDEITSFNYDSSYLIELNGKNGIYIPESGLLIPTRYDVIATDRGRYLVMSERKYGMYEENGKELLPCTFDSIYHFSETLALVNRSGILEQVEMTTGKQQPLKPDSIIRFETTAFMNFGKTFGDETVQTQHYFMKGYSPGTWYCVDLKTNAIIGKPYMSIGRFNEQGYAAAITDYYNSPIAINSKGEELKPKFHLEQESIFSAYIMDEGMGNQDSIIYQFQKHGLLTDVAPEDQWNYIQSNYEVVVEADYYYDEVGESYYSSYLKCYEKDSYFNSQTSFPKNPKYGYNFHEFYSRFSEANESGWRWAVSKSNDHDPDYRVDLEKVQVVLVSNEGEEISKPNYHPVQSTPFYEAVYTEDIQWAGLTAYPQAIDSLRKSFAGAASLSNAAFLEQYADSVYTEFNISYRYDEIEYEQTVYEYAYYRNKDIQLFNVAPPRPDEVEYTFVIDDFQKMAGGEQLTKPELLNRFSIDSKTAYSFGSRSYFAYPVLAENENKNAAQNLAKEYLQTMQSEEIAADLRNFDYFYNLVKTGVAERVDYDFPDSALYAAVMEYSTDFAVYRYTSSVGLAMENEIVLQPKYLAVGIDQEGSTIAETSFIVVDSLFGVNTFSLSNRKLSKLKDMRFCNSKWTEIIAQSKSTGLYNLYNKGTGINWDYNFLDYTISARDVKRLYYIQNCDYYPLMSVSGEDSIAMTPDGVLTYVYNDFCDTVVVGRYGVFPTDRNFHLYELADGSLYWVTGEKTTEIRFSEFVLQRNIPINEGPIRNFVIRETPEGLELYYDNKTIQLSESEYQKLAAQSPGDNGYGGVFIKGKFIPYQTFVPFPEKHAVYMHVSGGFWLVGNAKELQLVRLSDENSITKRYPDSFASFAEFREASLMITEGINPVQEFMWAE